MDSQQEQQNDRCRRLDNGHTDNNINNSNHNDAPMDSIDDNNNIHNGSYNDGNSPPPLLHHQQPQQHQQDQINQEQQEQVRPIPSTQDVHTREKLFDFIALMQGRRMDDQRAILKPSTGPSAT